MLPTEVWLPYSEKHALWYDNIGNGDLGGAWQTKYDPRETTDAQDPNINFWFFSYQIDAKKRFMRHKYL